MADTSERLGSEGMAHQTLPDSYLWLWVQDGKVAEAEAKRLMSWGDVLALTALLAAGFIAFWIAKSAFNRIDGR